MAHVAHTTHGRASTQPTPFVVVPDAPGGGCVERPGLQSRPLAPQAETRLAIIPAGRERLLGLDDVTLWHPVASSAVSA